MTHWEFICRERQRRGLWHAITTAWHFLVVSHIEALLPDPIFDRIMAHRLRKIHRLILRNRLAAWRQSCAHGSQSSKTAGKTP